MSKKILSLVLALTMCFSLATVAFADDDNEPEGTGTYTITVNKAHSGEEYSAYKIFDALIAYDSDGNVVTDSDGNVAVTYTIDTGNAWYGIVSAATDVFELKETSTAGTYYVTVKDGVSDADVIAVFTSAGVPSGAVAAATKNAPESKNADGSTAETTVVLDVSDSGPGYYFVITTLGATVSIDTTAPTATIEDKNTVPNVYKYEHDENHNDNEKDHGDWTDNDEATIGDTMDYEVFIDNIGDIISGLCLHDHMSNGLTFSGASSVKVYVGTRTEGMEAGLGYNNIEFTEISKDATVKDENGVDVPIWTEADTTCTDGCTFEIAFADAWTAEQGDDVVIKIVYSAVLNEEYNTETGEENDVFVSYALAGLTRKIEVDVYTYGFDLVKSNGEDQIDGAVFELYGHNNTEQLTFVYDKEKNMYIVYDAADDPNGEEETTTQIKVGKASIVGLEEGTYTLKEITAPDGYNKLDEDIVITITAIRDSNGDVTGEYTVSVSDESGSFSSVSGHTVTVINSAGSILPGTGGMGTTILYIIGGVLVVGAACLLGRNYIQKRRFEG